MPQRLLKADLILAANQAIGLDAVAVGDRDLQLGVEWLKEKADASGIPFLSANLVHTGGKTVFPPHLLRTLCGVKAGIFSVVTNLADNGKPLLANSPAYRIEDPVETARKEVAALRAEGAQVVIGLTHLGVEEDDRLAREVPGINLIFGGHSASQLAEPQRIGSTLVFQAGHKGKLIGRAEFELRSPLPGALEDVSDVGKESRIKDRIATYKDRIDELNQRIAHETDSDKKKMLSDQADFYRDQVTEEEKGLPKESNGAHLRLSLDELSRDVPDDPKVGALVEAAKTRMASLPPSAGPAGAESPTVSATPLPGPYVGAPVCQACHQQEYASWARTDHAKAYATLINEKHQVDYDCVSCHSTGYRQEGGPRDPFTVGPLGGVQCETCHGPGRAHAAAPKMVKLTTTFDEAFCRSCHSQEQTGDRFVFAQYLPKVQHGVKPHASK